MRLRRRPVPVTPPPDGSRHSLLAAALLFTTQPSDRALAGWSASEWAVIELEQLGVLSTTAARRETP